MSHLLLSALTGHKCIIANAQAEVQALCLHALSSSLKGCREGGQTGKGGLQ